MNNLFETLSNNPMIIVIGVLCVSLVLAIPCILYNKHLKNAENKFLEEHAGQAFLGIFGSNIKIDGKPAKEFECTDKSKEYIMVALEAGEHTISALFGPARSVDRFSAEREVKLCLEEGGQYSIGGYEYSAQQRRNYYKGDVPLHILDLAVENKFLICYKERD
ncbi:MAG: hypothetical protein PHX08_11790 [Lachnospiraceae bacterium]|nr:hypothetical protein [Lachnospiraceae bacterium]